MGERGALVAWKEEDMGQRLVKEEGGGHTADGNRKSWGFGDTCAIDRFWVKEISPECSLQGRMLKLKLQYFGHLIRRADSFEKTLIGKE